MLLLSEGRKGKALTPARSQPPHPPQNEMSVTQPINACYLLQFVTFLYQLLFISPMNKEDNGITVASYMLLLLLLLL